MRKIYLLHWIVPLVLMLFANTAQAILLIDDFSKEQAVESVGGTPDNNSMSIGLTEGTQLSGLTRTLLATSMPSSSGVTTEIDVSAYSLDIANSDGSSGEVSIKYAFSDINLSVIAESFILDVGYIDLKPVVLRMIANGTSIFAVNLENEGVYEVHFDQFSDVSVFANLSSLQFDLQGPAGWDMGFNSFSAESLSVPEPSTIALLILGFALTLRPRSRVVRQFC